MIFVKNKFLLIIFFTFSLNLLNGQVKVANVFTDHMVLQRNQAVLIKGTASPNELIKLKLGDREFGTKAKKDGKWMATTDAFEAGGPYTLTVTGINSSIVLEDILIGDVWLCGGQSNMEWLLKNTDRAEIDIAKANYPQIRHLEVKKELAFSPKDDILPTTWEVATPETVGDFTAVGYYFAKYLNAELGVPIGLLHSSWGGSHVETWTSKKAMKNSEVLAYYADEIPNTWEEDGQKLEKRFIKRLYGNPNFDVSQVDESDYLNNDFNFDNWTKIGTGRWDWQGFAGYRGEAFIHTPVELDQFFRDFKTELSFGTNTGEFTLYINGKLIAKGFYPKGIKLPIPKETWQEGTNHILMITSENDNGGAMGIYGAKQDFYIDNKSKKVYLAEEKWNMMPRWNDKRYYAQWMNNSGSICYNAMIAPLTDYAIKGAIWYQGESNANRAHQYRESFPLMIKNWRNDWGYDFPFLFVQLSSFGASQNSNEGSNWAELREAQTLTLSLPNTGMAVTTDIGNPADIHPKNKLDVGERLAKSALEGTYGKDIVGNGPMYKSIVVKKGKATISFSNVGSGLITKDKYGYLQGFEIAGSDQKFYYAQAKIVGEKVEVSHPMVSNPASVRYAWTNAPEDANLFNKDGFPASPFRTDDWKGVTEGVRFE